MEELTYTLVDDYYLPNIIVPEDEGVKWKYIPLGKYGLLHKKYLKEHRPILYTELLMKGKLFSHLHEVDETTATRLKLAGERYRQEMEEVILTELVYC